MHRPAESCEPVERCPEHFLAGADSSLAYDVRGQGPLVVCSPDVGDLRTGFAVLADVLAGEGYRVATHDLRGHGGSDVVDADPGSYAPDRRLHDLLALVEHLQQGDEPVVLAAGGSSAGTAVDLAAKAPDRVAALVLFNPDLRPEAPTPALRRLAGGSRTGRALWIRHWHRLHVRPPTDLAARRAELVAALAVPGRFEALRASLAACRDDDPSALLPLVSCPVLVMMGEDDPELRLPDGPAAHARAIAERLGAPARVLVVPGVGHYPHAEVPQVAAAQTRAFLHTHSMS